MSRRASASDPRSSGFPAVYELLWPFPVLIFSMEISNINEEDHSSGHF